MESKMFWGFFFIVLGAILLFNYAFGFNVPVFRVLGALAVIYLGVSILFGSFGVKISKLSTDNEAVFSTSQFKLNLTDDADKDQRKYNTVFGESELDLTGVDLSKGDVSVKMNTVFGETRLIVNKNTPLRVRTNSVFGNAALPGKDVSAMGKFNYVSEGLTEGAPSLNVDANVVFGEFQLIQR